jgi:hypothetical protein
LNFNKLIKNFTKDGQYNAESVDTLAEVYMQGEPYPIVLLEDKDGLCHVSFRRDLPPDNVSSIALKLNKIAGDIEIDPSFMICMNDGYVYGEEASTLYFTSIHDAIKSNRLIEEAGLDGAFYITEKPVVVYTKENKRITKNKKLWGDDKDGVL